MLGSKYIAERLASLENWRYDVARYMRTNDDLRQRVSNLEADFARLMAASGIEFKDVPATRIIQRVPQVIHMVPPSPSQQGGDASQESN